MSDSRPQHPWLDQLRRFLQYDEPFTDEQIRRVTAAYYGACTHLDHQIGIVLDCLREHGLENTTRVIYTSDHGENMGDRGLWGKFTMYEESIGVPLVMAGPDIAIGQTCDLPVSHIDVYPTILSAVGARLNEHDRSLPGSTLFFGRQWRNEQPYWL